MRDLAAQIFGILSAHGLQKETDFDRCLIELVQDTSNKKTLLEQQHGQLLAMAHAIERSIVIYRSSGTKDTAALQQWSTYKTVILTICKSYTVSKKNSLVLFVVSQRTLLYFFQTHFLTIHRPFWLVVHVLLWVSWLGVLSSL